MIKLQCLYSSQTTGEDLDTCSIIKEYHKYHLEIGNGNTVLSILMYSTAVKYLWVAGFMC